MTGRPDYRLEVDRLADLYSPTPLAPEPDGAEPEHEVFITRPGGVILHVYFESDSGAVVATLQYRPEPAAPMETYGLVVVTAVPTDRFVDEERDPSAFAVGDAMFPLTPAQAEQVRQFLASIPEAK